LKKTLVAAFALAALSFLVSLYFYGALPERMATHWNAAGQANGFTDKAFGAFMTPILSFALVVFFIFLPRVDPLRENYAKFQKHYDLFILFLSAFFAYINVAVIYSNLGGSVSFSTVLIPGFAALFYFLGVLMEKAERNWFVGIRTPWTLSSDRVWKRTHEIGGKLFKACGVVCLLGLVFPDWAIIIVVVPVVAAAVYSVGFSYVEFRKEKRVKPKK
jgi:uncharacterized membrane protein